ncbi:GntR family transcriptional regulator [Streptomyces cavernicola]|uniref:Winged helix-turn-helix domain-containing protein n=1 Tax=Streptomyces cavernicola TaxID=3043613 RepID=A0ABT6SCX0_9ACTN|nr:winged helix-turn-helix domain-containing protein [Streptomyces sp. B-S-A6]MDI3406041.1 winged helix-turn-helix domain-containing protein [Streptomyces sp. B-S-A6]
MDWTPKKPPSAKEIASRFRNEIAVGKYGPGQKLPGAKDLAKHLKVALMTVQSAYKELAEDGLVQGRQGSGTYVLDPKKGDPTAQDAAASMRDLQNRLMHVTSELSELRERVERLEAEHPRAVENQ